jgi:hypothetical protein
MSDAHVDALAQLISRDEATFASLPLPLAHRIFLALPADARGRASCVCRAWRDVLADPALWTRLDMSVMRCESHAEQQRLVSVLSGAAGRARGQLCLLEVSRHYLWVDVLLPVLTANAGSLRELHLETVTDTIDHSTECFNAAFPSVEAVMAAAPLLQLLTAEDVTCTWEEAPQILRGEPPFAMLLRRRLEVRFDGRYDDRVGGMERIGPFAAALADAMLQPALLRLCVARADTADPAVMGALVDAALARRLRALSFDLCTPPDAAPLARLLAEGSLTFLEIISNEWLFDMADAVLVADALRVNTTLTELTLWTAELSYDTGVAELLLSALAGHPSLRKLKIYGEDIAKEDCSAFGAALAALVAADAPALQALELRNNSLGDAGLAPIVEALALNRHLRNLDVSKNGMSEQFVRDRLLPAVRANAMLCELCCADIDLQPTAPEAEAEQLVRRRAQHG